MRYIPVVLFACAALAQPVQFEVASIRPTAAGVQDTVNIGLRMNGQQVSLSGMSLRDYIGMAYEVRAGQVSGPDWFTDSRFDLNATLPAAASTKQIPQMLQALLADRFGLKFHKEQKEFSVYALAPGSRPLSLTRVTAEPTDSGGVNVVATGSSNGVAVNLGGGASYTFANNKLEGKKLDMATLVDTLETYMDRPVVNQTNIVGFFDVTLDLTPEDYRVMLIRSAMANGIVLPPQAQRLVDGATTPSLFDGLEKVGLKLDPRRLPLEVIVVDQLAKAPSEN